MKDEIYKEEYTANGIERTDDDLEVVSGGTTYVISHSRTLGQTKVKELRVRA